MFSSSSLRLAVFYTTAFALAVAVLGVVTIIGTHAALQSQFDDRVRSETASVLEEYDTRGVRHLEHEVLEHTGIPGEVSFGVRTTAGAPLAGPLANLKVSAGWSNIKLPGDKRGRTFRVMAQDLPGGYRLIAADDLAHVQILDSAVILGFGGAFVGVILIGALGGLALSRDMHQRVSAMSSTAQAIIDGDMARRVPTGKAGDDLERLAQTMNRMLDRIGLLMDSLKQVSSDIAHDLRTPLSRLRQRLEADLERTDDPRHRAELEGALRDADAILATFAALLRIAQVEAGARRAAFRRLDLAALTQAVFEDYAPAAEDTGRPMTLDAKGAVWIDGDVELVNQMLVNLIENAMTHTPRSAQIDLKVFGAPEGPTLSVRDHGPGAPDAERQRLFDRFYRMERSRSTPGSGLGLSLVAAVARLHRAEVKLINAAPGLEARATFPQPPQA